jgi:phage virion morphogenesis protein
VQQAIEIKGLAEVQAAIRRLGLAANDTRRARAEVGEEMLVRTERRFAEERGPDGEKWKPSRRSELGRGKTLSQTGTLRGRIAYDTRSTEDLELYSWDKRARVHQLGLTITPKPGHEYLTIPLDETEVAIVSGEVKKGRDGRRARHYSGTFVARIHGRLFIMQRLSEGVVRSLFLLVRSVTMSARPFLGFNDDDLAMAMDIFARFFGAAFTGGSASA